MRADRTGWSRCKRVREVYKRINEADTFRRVRITLGRNVGESGLIAERSVGFVIHLESVRVVTAGYMFERR